MPTTLNTASVFLINSLIDIYLFVLMIRIILLWSRANFYHPLSQFIFKLTNPIITPFRRFIPNLFGIELASVLLMLVLEILKFSAIAFISMGTVKIVGVLILSCADILKITLNTFFYGILIQAILSWVQPGYSVMREGLAYITNPVLRPFQRFIPAVGGFDISPIPAMLFLQLLIIVLVNPLVTLGMTQL